MKKANLSNNSIGWRLNNNDRNPKRVMIGIKGKASKFDINPSVEKFPKVNMRGNVAIVAAIVVPNISPNTPCIFISLSLVEIIFAKKIIPSVADNESKKLIF